MKSIHPKRKLNRKKLQEETKKKIISEQNYKRYVAHMNALEIELSCTKTSPSQS